MKLVGETCTTPPRPRRQQNIRGTLVDVDSDDDDKELSSEEDDDDDYNGSGSGSESEEDDEESESEEERSDGDDDESSDEEDEDEEDERAAGRCTRNARCTNRFRHRGRCSVPKQDEGSSSSTTPIDYRAQAQEIFNEEKARIVALEGVRAQHKAELEKFKVLKFDRGTRRRGVCSYKNLTIGLSSKLVDGGASADTIRNIIVHELSHAACPKQKHNKVWKDFNILVGGDGKRCCNSAEAQEIIQHKYEVVCSTGGAAHYRKKMHKRSSQQWLSKYRCADCASKLVVRKL